ncbi:unnamed protein product [Boreogadus saida]
MLPGGANYLWGFDCDARLAVYPANRKRDMEKKRIVLRELSCRTASELPAPELPVTVEAGRRRSRPAAVRQLRRCTPGAELAPKLFGSSAAVRQLSSGSTIPFYS